LFYGKYSKTPIMEIKDSSLFQSTTTENRYCYSLTLPAEIGTMENLKRAMQKDLETYFGFEASIEIRKFPSWRLLSSAGTSAKLCTKGGAQKMEEIIPHVSLKFSNVPMKTLINYFLYYTNGNWIADETGITQNVDFTSDFMDFDGMEVYLAKYGLVLIPAEKEMKVLVIKDAKK
jgi:hypothetical protein